MAQPGRTAYIQKCVLRASALECRAVAMEPSVTCKVQVLPMDPAAPPGGDAQKGLKTKSLSQGKLVQVTLLAVRASANSPEPALMTHRCRCRN